MRIDLSRFDDKELWKALEDISQDINLEHKQDTTTIIMTKVFNGIRKEIDKRLIDNY